MNRQQGSPKAWQEALSSLAEKEELLVTLKQPITLESSEVIQQIPSCFLRFDRWEGDPFANDFGKGKAAMINLHGEHLFAEVAVLRLLQADGWSGRWIETYGGGKNARFLTAWSDAKLNEQTHVPIDESEPRELLAEIARRNGGTYDGCWDVFAWKDGQFLFVETKMQAARYRDAINENQRAWLKTALELNHERLGLSSFLLVQWDYRDDDQALTPHRQEPVQNTASRRALILLASRPESVENAVQQLQPEVMGLIVSQEILIPVALKCRQLEAHGVRFLFHIVDSPMEIEDSFERFEHLLSELEDLGYSPENIVLDATGGTTPMRLGAALAAMTRGMRMVHQRVPQRYVDGRWELDESKEIEVVPMDNPLESTGLLREGQAVELFNRRDYEAAALVFGDVAKKVTGVERRHYYTGLLRLAEGYGAWDVADYATALEKLRAAREELDIGFGEPALSERAGELVGRVTAHLSFLGKVRGKLSIENVVDMIENARRRIADQGRYDDGVARLYRAVEMWHQWRLLEKHSVSTKQVEWERVDTGVKERFLEAANLTQLPETLDLVRARTLDKILSGEPINDDNVLRDLLRQRNSSILAHGLEPIGEASARRFLEYVDAMVDEPEIRVAAQHARIREL